MGTCDFYGDLWDNGTLGFDLLARCDSRQRRLEWRGLEILSRLTTARGRGRGVAASRIRKLSTPSPLAASLLEDLPLRRLRNTETRASLLSFYQFNSSRGSPTLPFLRLPAMHQPRFEISVLVLVR
ncbi:unnamed protein product [Linum trigynum]|uniref:Uncharacterized protein n=1 Tax=Linum trigynum TaxID=586398 RepID=A0AAV2E0W9_9ROSI